MRKTPNCVRRFLIVLGVSVALVACTPGWAETEAPYVARPQSHPSPVAVNDALNYIATANSNAWYEWASQLPPPVIHHHKAGHSTGSDSKACVANTENGGDYGRSSNPSHFGRYQFDRQTWAGYGGDPGTWGSASPEEQDRVFERAWNSPGGPSHWLPYDPC